MDTPKTDSTPAKPPPQRLADFPSQQKFSSCRKSAAFVYTCPRMGVRLIFETATHGCPHTPKTDPLPRSPIQRVADFPSQQRPSRSRSSFPILPSPAHSSASGAASHAIWLGLGNQTSVSFFQDCPSYGFAIVKMRITIIF